MARLRMFLACLLLAAIPLQGLTAATMLFCGTGPSAERVATSAQAPHHADHEASAEHDHAAMHQHAGHGQAAVDDGTRADTSSAGSGLDNGHKCSICAACCHSVAISDTPQVPAFSAVHENASAQPLVLALGRPAPVPDKPPRA